VADKIVVYNQGWIAASSVVASYSQTVPYRISGASEAAKKGAVGALVQSVTDFSIASPHTGQQVPSYTYLYWQSTSDILNWQFFVSFLSAHAS